MHSDTIMPQLDLTIPPTSQPDNGHILLPDDLFVDWPFDFGQGPAFDFLGDLTELGIDGDETNGVQNGALEGESEVSGKDPASYDTASISE